MGPCRSERAAKPVEFIIDETFGVPGVGTVVAGTVKQGVINTNSNLLLGPSVGDGAFRPTAIKSIHYKRLPVSSVRLSCLKASSRLEPEKGRAASSPYCYFRCHPCRCLIAQLQNWPANLNLGPENLAAASAPSPFVQTVYSLTLIKSFIA